MEAVLRVADDGQPLPSELVGGIRQENAEGPIRSSPDPTAQLMELREPESLRILDEHDARVRHVDADLDDGRGHEYVHLPRREGAHRGVADVGPLLAMDEADLQPRQGGPEPLALRLGTRNLEYLGLRDEGR